MNYYKEKKNFTQPVDMQYLLYPLEIRMHTARNYILKDDPNQLF